MRDRLSQAEEIFHAALEASTEERGAFLSQRCADDHELRALVERLLAHHDAGMSGFLRVPARDSGPESSPQRPAPLPGAIGPYRILEEIGEGGMGTVYVARQTKPVRRDVALKIIKAGMGSKQVIARFEAERQALALMDHPNIAKVLDAGETEDGHPYFVMELMRGALPIHEFCDRHRLTTRERLELFHPVCEAVQHAHQKAIIHRDLKPTNVLVVEQDGQRHAKVIDFGVAKATAQRLTEKTMFTELGVLIGTPEYMSPEQADLSGEDVDTRSDVYSLGAILYELLVGALPFDSKQLRSEGLEGIRKMIRETEPKRPSARLTTLGDGAADAAQRRRTDVPNLLRQLRGDLDWIALKALEKDRARRYTSPSDLAADIKRHLKDEPVHARPPSTAYRAQKFVRRHRLGVTAAALVTLALVAAVVGTTAGLVRARHAEAAARAEQERSARVATFLASTLSDVDPASMGLTLGASLHDQVARHGGTSQPSESGPAARPKDASFQGLNLVDVAGDLVDDEILRKAVKRIEQELTGEPALAADVYSAIGDAYVGLQRYRPAADCCARAVELSERARGPDHLSTNNMKIQLGNVYRRGGRYRDAQNVYLEALQSLRRTRGEDARETLIALNWLADTYWYQGRASEAERLHRDALQKMRRVLGEEDVYTLVAANDLALALRDMGRLEEAEALFRDTVEKLRRVYGAEDREAINTATNLATVLILSGHNEEAEKLLLELQDTSRRVVGDEAYLTLCIRQNLVKAYKEQKRYEEAEALARDNLATMRRSLGEEHPETLLQMEVLGALLWIRGHLAEAETILLQALAVNQRTLGERHPRTLEVSQVLASVYGDQKRFAEAEAIYLATARTLQDGRAVELDRVYSGATYNLALLSAARGDRSKALEWLTASVDAGPDTTPDLLSKQHGFENLHGAEFDALVARAGRQ